MKKKVALITGATGNIGSAICKLLAKNSYCIVLNTYSKLDEAEQLKSNLDGNDHHIFRASVTNSNEVQSMAKFVESKYGYLNLLVNNAGVTVSVAHEDLNLLADDLIDRIFQVNVRGSLACVRIFKDLLLKGDNSVIANISSIAAQTGIGSNVAYCGSKAAMNTITKSLARALAPDIRVVAIAPGWVDGKYAKKMPKEYIELQKESTPLKRLAQAEDVAKAVLATVDLFKFSTGCIFPVDGGRPLM